MSKLGADVTGVDIVEKNIKTASAHAKNNKLPIKYLVNTVEELATKKNKI
jgi:2-polyprenyl-3-methyl-5-hydroxy-6-metoxy-1,4-benzoquinol methylase